MTSFNRKETFFVKNFEIILEEAHLVGMRLDVQLGHFIILFIPNPQRLLWLTSFDFSKFSKGLLSFDL